MGEREERVLHTVREQLEQINIPEHIDQYIRNGMEKGKGNRRKRKMVRLFSFAACFLLLAFVVSIRFSPSVAAYASRIPGLDFLVDMIRFDKGLQLAAENDYIQKLNVSDEHDGVKLTAEGMIVDESRILLFISVENNKNDKNSRDKRVSLDKIDLYDERFLPLKIAALSWGGPVEGENEIHRETIDIQFPQDGRIPDQLNLKIKLRGYGDQEWKLSIPVDKRKFEGMKEVYAVNRTVEIEGQKITFGKLTVYPTRIALEINYDTSNSKKILGFDDIRIVDENGNSFGTITNGMLASNVDENNQILYFQSNYFTHPKEMYIEASSLRALDKDKLEVVVDLEKGILLKKPDDRLGLKEVDQVGANLVFTLDTYHPMDKNVHYHLFSSIFRDASGKEFYSSESYSTKEEVSTRQKFGYTLPDGEYQNPITLYIENYPERITGKIRIKVK